MTGFGKHALYGLDCPRLEPVLDRLVGIFIELGHVLEDGYDIPNGYRLEFLVSEVPVVNARAYRNDERRTYCIDFTLGLIVWLDSLSATLAAHVARDFEVAPHPELTLGVSDENWRDDFQARLDLCTAQLPESYYGAWESFFQKAAIGIFAHEFCHLGRGHIDWLRTRSSEAILQERSLRAVRKTISDEEARFIEFDADWFAARMIGHLSLEPPPFMKRWHSSSPTENIIETLLGLIIFFVAIEAEELGGGVRAPDYPRPLLRMIVMLVEIDPIWSKQNPNGDFFDDVFGGALSILVLYENLYVEIDLLCALLEKAEFDALIEEASAVTGLFDTVQHEIVEYAFDGEGLWRADEDEDEEEDS